MSLDEIKDAVINGKIVCWVNVGYEVVKTIRGEFYVLCKSNDNAVGLTDDSGVLQGKECDFFINEVDA